MMNAVLHGPHFDAEKGPAFRLWAPRARQVTLVMNPGFAEQKLRMESQERGWFTLRLDSLQPGARYLFEFENGRRLPDPASRWQPDGVHEASALVDPLQFRWTDNEWRGLELDELVIYELHVGTFTPAGTFDAIIPRLRELRELGVTALEVMPIAQFPGTRGWGYDGVFPFAAQNSYGGPAGFQRLVDACHREGMAVLLDVVYNHFGPEGNYLGEYGPYFTEKYQTPWGTAINYDSRGSDEVRQFVFDNVRWWLREFHLDGLRLDAVHAIYDSRPSHLLRDIGQIADEEAKHSGRKIHITAESNSNDVRLLNARDCGGYGLAAQWSDDFHHCVHTLLTGELEGYYSDFGKPEQLAKAFRDFFVYDGCYSAYRERRHGAPVGACSGERFIVAIQNHDQVGNRALGERFGTLLSPAQQRFAASLLLLAPNLPLLFMGEEYGEKNPFPFFCDFQEPALIEAVHRGRAAEFSSFSWPDRIPDAFAPETFAAARLSWNWQTNPEQAGLRKLYATLLQLRRELPALRNFVDRDSHWHPAGNSREGIVELIRGAGLERAIALFNCSSERQPLLPALRTSHGQAEPWRLVFSSEAPQFIGQRGECPTNQSTPDDSLLPFEAQLYILAERTSS